MTAKSKKPVSAKRAKPKAKIKARKRKILVINYEFPPLGGGGGVASYDLAVEWAKKGEVDVITSAYQDTPLFEKMDGINVHRIKVWGRNSRDAASLISMFSYLLFGFFKTFSLARKRKFDIINTHFALPSGPLGFAISLLFRIPNVLSIHGGDIYDPSKKLSPHRNFFFKRIVKFVLNHAQSVVAQSSNTRDNAVTYYRPKKEIVIIPLAFHPPKPSRKKFTLPGAKKGDFTLVTIGRLVKRKSVETILEAMAALRDDKVKLYILGDGPERSDLERRTQYHNLSSAVHFAGFVTEEEKYQYLSAVDAYIMTSLHEGFGIVFMEAMHSGLPIISTNHGGQTDFLFNEVNSLLLNVGDVAACAQSIARVKSDRKLYQKLSDRAKKDIRQFFASNVAAQYEKIFNELTGA